MAKKKAPEPAVRKSFIVTGGIALGAAVFGFVLVNFVFGRGGGSETATELATLGGATIPIASAPPAGAAGTDPIELTPGGRDPFVVKVAADTGAASGATASTSSVVPPAAAPAPALTSVPPPAPATQPAAQPAPQPAPTAAPRPVYGKQTITVLAVYSRSADVRIDDTVYEGAHARDELTERFNVDGFSRGCLDMNDMFPADSPNPQRFTLCRNDTVTR